MSSLAGHGDARAGHGSNGPFTTAARVRPLGDGTFAATLSGAWTIGGKPHGGFLVSLLTRAAVAAAGGGTPAVDPLTVSAQFLRPPELGPVLLRTEVRKDGGQTTVVGVQLEQRGQSCVEGVVTTGRLPRRSAVPLPHRPPKPVRSPPGTRRVGTGRPRPSPAIGTLRRRSRRVPAQARSALH